MHYKYTIHYTVGENIIGGAVKNTKWLCQEVLADKTWMKTWKPLQAVSKQAYD